MVLTALGLGKLTLQIVFMPVGNALRKQGKMKHAHAVLVSGLEKCKTKLGDIEVWGYYYAIVLSELSKSAAAVR